MGDDKVNYNSEFKSTMNRKSMSDANLGHNNMASKGRETHWTTGDRNQKIGYNTSAKDQMQWKQPVVRFDD